VYKFGASDPAAQEMRPNNLLMWRAILTMKELGAKTLSFGRTSVGQEGLSRFKRSFGAKESTLYYAKYDYNRGDFVTEQADRSSGLNAKLFRLCPKPLARLIGTALYPHVG
jgi:lipid II:glycine glycyltransferase (peptidoglycan interpeptide bridge formation enzyme)